MRRRSRVQVSMQVPYLTVASPWRVGLVTFSPAGYLRDRLAARGGLDWARVDGKLPIWATEPLEAQWATARTEVPVMLDKRGRDNFKGAIAAARGPLRDSIAVLTFLQRTATNWSTNTERFGLAVDVGHAQEWYWVTTRAGRYLYGGTSLHGSLGPWRQSAKSIRAHRANPKFQFLDAALLKPDDERTDFERRILASLRTWTIGNELDRPTTRIVLAATALEALLGNKYSPGARATGGHRLASRASYLFCGSGIPPSLHGPGGRGLCPFLGESTASALDELLREDHAKGHDWVCDYYADLRDFYDDRNAAVHGAEVGFDEKRAGRHEYTVEQVLALAIDWTLRTGKGDIQAYDAEIDALPLMPNYVRRQSKRMRGACQP